MFSPKPQMPSSERWKARAFCAGAFGRFCPWFFLPTTRTAPRLSPDSCAPLLESRIFRGEHAGRVVLPNPSMNQPLRLGDEMTTFLATLVFGQAVRVIQAG